MWGLIVVITNINTNDYSIPRKTHNRFERIVWELQYYHLTVGERVSFFLIMDSTNYNNKIMELLNGKNMK